MQEVQQVRSILILSDTLNRRFLHIYNESGLFLPNLDRLAKRSVIFDNHWVGSAPCMPARRDLMTGRLNFLERNWGPIEPMDYTLTQALRTCGVRSHMITDHYHYFEIGGENYCQMFNSWQLVRGQEWDPCVSRLSEKPIPEHLGQMHPQYWRNREEFIDDESRYPSAVVLTKAARWLEENADEDDFLLWVEPFDPHEPFEVPEKYLKEVGDTYDGPLFLWPEYKTIQEAGLTEEQVQHIRNRYLALLLMTDHYLGQIFDVMDRHHMWDDTLLILTTDHGCHVGEHDYLAKNFMPAYNEVFHIPLVVHMPKNEYAGKHVDALTQNIDMMPTLLEYFGVPHNDHMVKMHGRSFLPVIRGEKETCHDAVLYGYYGKQMNVTDGRYTYFRSPLKGNRPLNLYTAMPVDMRVYFSTDRILDRSAVTADRFLKWTDYPVYRFPVDVIADDDPGCPLRFIGLYDWEYEDRLFDLKEDYEQNVNLVDQRPDLVEKMKKIMRDLMVECDSPDEQFERLNLR